MARLSMWNSGQKGKNYKFFDRAISEFFSVSGTALYVHLYEGVYDQEAQDGSVMAGGTTSIQDPLLLENRDRKYSKTIYELRCAYNVADVDFDLRQFGLFLTNDTVFIEVHLNDMIATCGRRIVAGDVIELPHMRDDTSPAANALNKFYVVEDATKSSDGYSATWFAHIWRLKCSQMTAGQEFEDILSQPATDAYGIPLTDGPAIGSGTGDGLDSNGNAITIGDIISTAGNLLDINTQVYDQALDNFMKRNFETRQFWMAPDSELAGETPWVFAGDGYPPNGYEAVGSGITFPTNPSVGDYFLRVDYSPTQLFKRIEGSGWQMQEFNFRVNWTPASTVLNSFFENTKENTFSDGTVIKEKQALSKLFKPKADF